MSTYDFSTLYTTLPHNLIKDKLVALTERTFQREGSVNFCEPSCLFYLSFNFDFYVSKIMHL